MLIFFLKFIKAALLEAAILTKLSYYAERNLFRKEKTTASIKPEDWLAWLQREIENFFLPF
jgi:hypothetical protein